MHSRDEIQIKLIISWQSVLRFLFILREQVKFLENSKNKTILRIKMQVQYCLEILLSKSYMFKCQILVKNKFVYTLGTGVSTNKLIH